MPDLQQKSILITRPAQKAASMAELVKKGHGTPVIFPTIEIGPPSDWEKVDEAIVTLRQFDWVVFSSAHGVKFFTGRLQTRSALDILESFSIAAVGSKTANALRKRGVPVDFIPPAYTADSLLEGLKQKQPESQAFLLVSGDKGRKTLSAGLRSAGASVESVVAYRNIKPDPENVRDIVAQLQKNAIDFFTFTSPSTFQNFVDLIQDHTDDISSIMHSAHIAAIGPVTAGVIEDYGYRAEIVPASSTIEDMINQIGRYIQQETQSTETSAP